MQCHNASGVAAGSVKAAFFSEASHSVDCYGHPQTTSNGSFFLTAFGSTTRPRVGQGRSDKRRAKCRIVFDMAAAQNGGGASGQMDLWRSAS